MRSTWHCVVCDRGAAIEHSQYHMVGALIADVREDHAAKAPWCDFDREFVRVELELFMVPAAVGTTPGTDQVAASAIGFDSDRNVCAGLSVM